MLRVKQIALPLLMLTGVAFAALPAVAAENSAVLAQAQRPAPPAPVPAPPPALNDWLSSLRVEHVIAVGVGGFAGDLLHGAVGLSATTGLLVGGVVGYYVYVNYIDKPDAQGTRRIDAVADEAKVYLIAAKDSILQLSEDFLGSKPASP